MTAGGSRTWREIAEMMGKGGNAKNVPTLLAAIMQTKYTLTRVLVNTRFLSLFKTESTRAFITSSMSLIVFLFSLHFRFLGSHPLNV